MISAFQEHQMMGVINITPNSFSDGGNHLDQTQLIETIELFNSLDCKIFDFGAESTAPMNDSISEKEEQERFETYFYPLLQKKTFKDDTIFSIDTYRPENFLEVRNEILKSYPDSTVYFNDVSGLIPTNLDEIMNSHDKTFYVFGHNHIPRRSLVNNHMDYIKEYSSKEDLLFDLINHFTNASFKFVSSGVSERVIFDPCFGFSKSFEQNIWLMDVLPRLIQTGSKEQKWLIGISRKSFLQKTVTGEQDLTEKERIRRSEMFHSIILSRWMKTLSRNDIIYRVHDPALFDIARRSIMSQKI